MSEEISVRSEVGSRIREIRLSRSITGKELADRTKISQGYLSEVERGMSVVSIDKLLRIADALGVSVQHLVGPGPDDSPNSQLASSREVTIPAALSDAAESLQLSYSATLSLLNGYLQLTARRSRGPLDEMDKAAWIDFYENVKAVINGDIGST